MGFLLDISPLKKSPDFRRLFSSQIISYLGTALTQVAIPYQLHLMTHSTAKVGMLGLFQLIPMAVGAVAGGKLADQWERKKIVVAVETLMMFLLFGLALLTFKGLENLTILYGFSSILAFLGGIHRPSLDSLAVQTVHRDDYLSLSALNGMRYTFAAIIGPGVAGVLIASFPIQAIYWIDGFTYFISAAIVLGIKGNYVIARAADAKNKLWEGFKIAAKNPVLLGTYFVDMASMTFAFPNLIFPKLSDSFGGSKSLGFFYSSIAVGAFSATLVSGWTKKIVHQGRFIVFSAACWTLGISLIGFSRSLPVIVAGLVFAGFWDMFSGIFRGGIWNDIIPTENRGKFVAIEMLSYMSGPLSGSVILGFLAETHGVQAATRSSSLFGFFLVLAIGFGLRGFWNYQRPSDAKT